MGFHKKIYTVADELRLASHVLARERQRGTPLAVRYAIRNIIPRLKRRGGKR